MSQAAPAAAPASPAARRSTSLGPRVGDPPAAEVAVLVGSGARFEGLVCCPRAARIEGELVGDVLANDRIEIAEGARVRGRIEARDIVIAGHFEGELFARQAIELLPSARVEGDLRARELTAHEGCSVSGRCSTGASAVDPDRVPEAR